jgi:hypothetical protein
MKGLQSIRPLNGLQAISVTNRYPAELRLDIEYPPISPLLGGCVAWVNLIT